MWQDTVKKAPGKARPHNNFGHALKEKKRIEEALIHFEWAIRLDPDYTDALNNLATIYGTLGKREEALALLHKTLSLNPNHISARYNLAINYYEMGMLTESVNEYNTILELDPLCKEAQFARQMLRLIQGQMLGD